MEPLPKHKPIRSAKRRMMKWLLVAANVIILVVVGVSAANHLLQARALPRHFHVVEPGRLYRSGQPTPEQLANIIKQHGIRTVVNLRGPEVTGYVDDAPTAQEYGACVVSLPISSIKPLSEDQLATLRRIYEDPRNYPILVHCEAGRARTGVAVALWRIERQGWAPAKAVEEMIASGYPIRDKNADMRELLVHWQRPAEAGKPASASEPIRR
jgi:protein tyrosine/serine phosphatase